MSLNKYGLKTPFYALAPMANISTYPFALQCVRYGADLVWTPMVHTDTIINNWPEAKKILDFEPSSLNCHSGLIKNYNKLSRNPDSCIRRNDKENGIKNYLVQIVGSDPDKFIKSVKIIEKGLDPFGIDLNFGCPDKNIVKSGCGGAMLKNPARVVEIVKAVKNATRLPLSIKTRAGWDDLNQIYKLAPELEKAGIDMLTVHPRTVKQGFRGKAD